MARILGDNGINMQAFSLAENADFGILRMIVSDVDLAVPDAAGSPLWSDHRRCGPHHLPDTPGAWLPSWKIWLPTTYL